MTIALSACVDFDTVADAGDMLSRIAKFSLLPSLTLHSSRMAQFDPTGAWRALLKSSNDPGSIHRHWSQDILQSLKLDDPSVLVPRDAAFDVALLPADSFGALGRWLGAQLCGPALRTLIQKTDLQCLFSLSDAHYIKQARRKPIAVQYVPARHWDATQIAQNSTDLGNAALLHACSASCNSLHKYLALKLPETQLWPDLPAPDLLIHACFEFLNE